MGSDAIPMDTIESVHVQDVIPYPPIRKDGKTRYEVWCLRPGKVFSDLVIDVWEDGHSAFRASLCKQAQETNQPVTVHYRDGRQWRHLVSVKLAEDGSHATTD